MATTGKKENNISASPNATSWEDLYQIDAEGLTNATAANFKVLPLGMDDKTPDIAFCFYFGSGALTTSEFNNLPIGSVIWCPAITTAAVYLKTAATTWKYQAINT